MQSCFFVLRFVFAKHTKFNHTLETLLPTVHSTLHAHLKNIVSSQAPLPTEQKLKGRGDNILEGTVVKAKIGELEEEVRASSSRIIRKEFTGVVQGVSGMRSFLVRFQNGYENNLSLNQLTVVIVDKIPVEEEPEVSTIPEIPEDQVEKEKV